MKRLLCLLLLCVSAVAQSPVDSLVAVERAFAKKSRDTNIREAFLAYFADDGVVFTPSPTNAKELYTKRPVPPNPPPFMLDWEPAYADVSRAGDLGYTTGPFSITDNAKHAVTDHGTFFSVWEKQKDGDWKVVLDFGVPTKAAHTLRPIKLTSGTPSAFQIKPGTNANADAQKLMSMEAQLTGESYGSALDSHAYVVQDGLQPLTPDTTREKHLQNMKTIKAWKVLGGGASKSGDLAYTYGSYQATAIGSHSNEVRMGYYARVWKRNDRGEWKIVLDNTEALHAPTPVKKK
jgi:ketosteroid isomerase-like protein